MEPADQPNQHAQARPELLDEVEAVTAGSRLLDTVDVRTVSSLGAGTDHRAYLINGELVLRCELRPSEEASERIRREVALLAVVTERSPIPVPTVRSADATNGLMLLDLLPGTPLLDHPGVDPAVVVDSIQPFLAAIHTTPVDLAAAVAPTDTTSHAEYLSGARSDYETIAHLVDEGHRLLISRFLHMTLPTDPPTGALALCHADLGAEHLLVTEPVRLSGVIDWSDAAITDRARDYGKLVRDLGLTALQPALDLAARTDSGLVDRALFHARCALIEDLRFGLETGDHRYSNAAIARIPTLFEA